MPFIVYANFQALDPKILFRNFHKGCSVQLNKNISVLELISLSQIQGTASEGFFFFFTYIPP